MKKIFLIGTLLILAYSQVGYYFVMRNSQYQWKEEMKQKVLRQLKADELEIISYTDNQQKIYWEDEEKNEFSFKGEMYDVVKRVAIHGKIMLYCISDKKEKQLIDHYNSITKNNSDTGKKAKDNLNNSINLFVYEDEELKPLSFFSTSTQFLFFTSHLNKGVADNTIPPPKA